MSAGALGAWTFGGAFGPSMFGGTFDPSMFDSVSWTVDAWTVAHAGGSASGVAAPHAVLLAFAVLGLWLAVAGGVVAAEAVLDRIS